MHLMGLGLLCMCQIAPPPSWELPKGYLCYQAGAPIQVDGKLDDPAWQNVPWSDAFVDIEGDRRPKPRFRTQVKMLWDDNYFYIGASLEEPHAWGTLTRHDSVIFHDNDFEVFLDPDGDNHQYYEVEINALNTEWDLRLVKPYRDGGPALNEWEIPGLKTAVFVDGTLNNASDTDRSWSVELAFPWRVLVEFANRPAPPHDGDQWRINFSRVEWRHDIVNGQYRKVPGTREDNWVWSPQGVIDMHRPEMWGYVQFTTAAPGKGRFRPDPAWPVRVNLHRLYYAERDYHKAHGRWTDDLKALGLALSPVPSIRLTREGYEASIRSTSTRGQAERWTIRQDSRIQRQ